MHATTTDREPGRTSTPTSAGSDRTVLLFLGVLAAGLLAGLVALWTVPPPSSFPPGLGYPPSDYPGVFDVITVIAMMTVAVLLALCVVYWSTYRTVRTPFTLGLALVFTILSLGALLASPFAFDTFRMGRFPDLGYPTDAIAELANLVAFSILLYVSL